MKLNLEFKTNKLWEGLGGVFSFLTYYFGVLFRHLFRSF